MKKFTENVVCAEFISVCHKRMLSHKFLHQHYIVFHVCNMWVLTLHWEMTIKLLIVYCICKEAPLEFDKKTTLVQHFLPCSSCDSEEVIV